MQIDIASEDGNTLVALGHARRLMKKAKRDPADIVALTQAVFAAHSAKEAREAITKATFGSITFFNSNDGD
jgi:hypothetical protein